ncbi:hypothetical protein [Microbacterium ulmi]|uniref:Uncharacterized protein n=1 Tax=Microbacterium ulmi TaxID=179095 RepID=A0A7Y2M2F3_9MICO|nr:hypothetical protein [Microbacterium ulmi]NII68794.1 hypothetical protein [Microbacterium ulmi]NNH04774.1 hypothetical protein [Microbacterium ulmi]
MEPAEKHAVVCVRRSAGGVFRHVVDLAPPRRDAASGDDAVAVAKSDRTALVAVEDTLLCAEAEHPAVRAERDPLHDACATDVSRRGASVFPGFAIVAAGVPSG